MKSLSFFTIQILLVLSLALAPQLALQSSPQPAPHLALQSSSQLALRPAPRPSLHSIFIACEFGPGSCPCPGC